MPAAHPRPLFCNVPAGPFRSELVPGDPFRNAPAEPFGMCRRASFAVCRPTDRGLMSNVHDIAACEAVMAVRLFNLPSGVPHREPALQLLAAALQSYLITLGR